MQIEKTVTTEIAYIIGVYQNNPPTDNPEKTKTS
jgi:hypothetical protein